MNEALATRTSLRNTEPAAAERMADDSMFDRDSDANLLNQADWCVDLGTELKAMNKFELWLALGTGDVASTTPVWRVGRECWQPAFEIPDLACALKLHAQVLMATVRAAESADESDRVTLVPGELPILAKVADEASVAVGDADHASVLELATPVLELADDSAEVVALPDDATLEDDVLEDAVLENVVLEVAREPEEPLEVVAARCLPIPRFLQFAKRDMAAELCEPIGALSSCNVASLNERTSLHHAFSNPAFSNPSFSDSGALETEMQQSTDRSLEEVDAKSVTPGPAVVDAPIIEQSVIRQRRGLPRKKETSIWSGVAALGALAATTLLTLPGALSGNTPSAAAHLPNLIVPSAWIAAAHAAPSATPFEASVGALPAQTDSVALTDRQDAASNEAASSEAASSETTAARETKSPSTHRLSKHHVRPTSVSPSHRGQGRSRQHSR